MNSSCSGCGKPFAVPGSRDTEEVSPITCVCGRATARRGGSSEAAPRDVPAAGWPNEPAFVRASGSSESISIDVALDPDELPTLPDLALPPARVDGSRPGAAQVPLDWALRRMRAQSLLSGLASGAVVAVAFLAWQSFATRGPPLVTPAAAVAGETASAGDRGAPARQPAHRRSGAPGARSAGDRAPARPMDSVGSGWAQVEDSGGEEATPGAEAGDGEGTLAETGDVATAEGHGATVDDGTARASLPGGDETRGHPPADEVGTGAESADGEPGTRPTDAGPQAYVPLDEGGAAAEPAATGEPGTPPSDAEPLAAGHAPDASEVAAALRVRRAELEACLAEPNAASGGAPQRSRSLRLVVVVDPSGRVSSALLNDEPGDSTPLGACLLRIAQAMSFTPFEGDPARVRLALSRVAR